MLGAAPEKGGAPGFWTAAEKAEPLGVCGHTHLALIIFSKILPGLVSLMMPPVSHWSCRQAGVGVQPDVVTLEDREVRSTLHLPFLLKTHLLKFLPFQPRDAKGSLVSSLSSTSSSPPPVFFFPLSLPSLPSLSCSCQDVNG